jgi:hypothetical protein
MVLWSFTGNSAPTRQIRGEKGVKQEDDVAFSAETKKRPEPLRDTTAGTEPKAEAHTAQLNSIRRPATTELWVSCRVVSRGVAWRRVTLTHFARSPSKVDGATKRQRDPGARCDCDASMAPRTRRWKEALRTGKRHCHQSLPVPPNNGVAPRPPVRP